MWFARVIARGKLVVSDNLYIFVFSFVLCNAVNVFAIISTPTPPDFPRVAVFWKLLLNLITGN